MRPFSLMVEFTWIYIYISAILFHCTDITNAESQNGFCLPGENSWCKCKEDIVTGKSTYKKTINLPKWIYHIIRPVFDALADNEFLSKCFHGETQNPNEAFNNIVWTRCPKTIYVSRSVMELGVNSAVLHYNEGACGISNVFSYFKIDNGYYMEKGSIKRNKVSIRKMDIKSLEGGNTRIKKIRAVKKGLIVNEKENEPSEPYIAGGF